MEILAYLYMALSYEESQPEASDCMRDRTEESPQKNREYATSSTTTKKNRCFFRAVKA